MAGWEKGILYGEGQNLARLLMEGPANLITPTAFADTIEEKLAPYSERVTVHKRYVQSCIDVFACLIPMSHHGFIELHHGCNKSSLHFLWVQCHTKGKCINPNSFSRSQGWIEEQQMGAFLSVSKGSEEPPVFLELHYNGSPDKTQAPLLLVGKGITFDR